MEASLQRLEVKIDSVMQFLCCPTIPGSCVAGSWIADLGVPAEELQKQCDATVTIQQAWKRKLSSQASQVPTPMGARWSTSDSQAKKSCSNERSDAFCDSVDVASSVSTQEQFFKDLASSMRTSTFANAFTELVGSWAPLELSAEGCGIEGEHVSLHESGPSCGNDAILEEGVPAEKCVTVVVFGSIDSDSICDYLETFGKIRDLVEIYTVGKQDVELFRFEDAAGATAASHTLVHHATNASGQRVKLEILREPSEYSIAAGP